MAILRVDVDLYCICGDELWAKETTDQTLIVTPCDSCMDKKYAEGYREGEAAQED